jgi:hypothetical protein
MSAAWSAARSAVWSADSAASAESAESAGRAAREAYTLMADKLIELLEAARPGRFWVRASAGSLASRNRRKGSSPPPRTENFPNASSSSRNPRAR